MIKAVVSAGKQSVTTSEQLTLLPTSQVNTRFRLSKSTRERGLRHVTEIREQLAANHQNSPIEALDDRAA